jgi:hypothetical protein
VTGDDSAQVGFVNVSPIKVTAPLRARARPWTVTLRFTVILVRARMLPTNVEPVPSVAELPTCQKTLHSWAPLINVTVLLDPVMTVAPRSGQAGTALVLVPGVSYARRRK